jgi:hypothetical protein
VAGQANSTAELPEISRYWISNWEFAPSAITPKRQRLCGLQGLFRGNEVLAMTHADGAAVRQLFDSLKRAPSTAAAKHKLHRFSSQEVRIAHTHCY